MMTKLTIAGVTLLVTLSGFGTIDLVFAETYQVIIVQGSAFDPSCAKTDSCLKPSHLSILQGDYVTWIRQDDISMPIQSGTPETGPDMKFRVGGTGLENTFDDIGTFPYYISDMPWIQGEIVVDYTTKKLGNYIDFTRIEKRFNSVLMDYEGHIDVNSAFFKIYDYTNYEIGYTTIESDDDGYFSGRWGEEDSILHPWVEGVYRVELFIEDEGVDEGGGSLTTPVLAEEFTFKLEFLPEGNTRHQIRILDGSMDKKCGDNCMDPPTLYIQRGDRIKIVHNDCEGCHHITVKIHDPTIRSQEFSFDENYRWWDQTTWTYYDKVNPWITGQFVVGAESPKQILAEPVISSPSVQSEPQLDETKLPEWIRNIFIWYAEDRISEDELLGAIQFLVQQGIIQV